MMNIIKSQSSQFFGLTCHRIPPDFSSVFVYIFIGIDFSSSCFFFFFFFGNYAFSNFPPYFSSPTKIPRLSMTENALPFPRFSSYDGNTASFLQPQMLLGG